MDLFNTNKKKISDLYDNIGRLQREMEINRERISETISKIDLLLGSKPETLTEKDQARLADLEIKMAKLWGLLLETTPSGKEKLSKFGRRFGGQAKNL